VREGGDLCVLDVNLVGISMEESFLHPDCDVHFSLPCCASLRFCAQFFFVLVVCGGGNPKFSYLFEFLPQPSMDQFLVCFPSSDFSSRN
jgi:hypothetical protein